MVSIDTLEIKLTDWDLKAGSSKLDIISGSKNINGDLKVPENLLFKIGDNRVYGIMAIWNGENYHLDYKHTINGYNWYMHFSIPKVYNNGNNFNPVNKEDTKAVLKHIENKLKEDVNLYTNINSAQVKRFDLFKNAVTEYPYRDYEPLFNILPVNRTNKEVDRKVVDTYYKGNKQHCLVTYNKIKEMVGKNLDISNLPENVIRFEYRILKPEKVSSFGIKTCVGVVNKFDEFEGIYNKYLKDNIFKKDIPEMKRILEKDFKSMLEQYKNESRPLNALFKYYGILFIVKNVGVDIVIESVKSVLNYDKSTLSRLRRDLKLVEYEINRDKIKDTNMQDLYNELKYKLVS